DHGVRVVLDVLQELAGGLVIVSDQGATNRPSNVLRVSTLSEETSRQAQTGETQTLFLEVRAVDLEARLVRLSTGSLVVASDIIIFGHVPGGLRQIGEQVREVGTVREADATTSHVDLREREQTLTGLGLHEVVDRFGWGAPATGSDERTTGETGLVDGELHGLFDRVRGVFVDGRFRRIVTPHRGNAHLLTDMTTGTTGRVERGLVERLQTVIDDIRRVDPVQTRSRFTSGHVGRRDQHVLDLHFSRLLALRWTLTGLDAGQVHPASLRGSGRGDRLTVVLLGSQLFVVFRRGGLLFCFVFGVLRLDGGD